MNNGQSERGTSKMLIFAGLVIVVGALHIARDVFIPVAIAILLSFLLAPLASRMTRWGLPNAAAVLASVAVAFTVLGIVGWLVSAQFVNLVSDLPKYQDNLQKKIASLKERRDGAFSRAGKTLGELKREIETKDVESDDAIEASKAKPIPVQIEQPSSPFQLLKQVAGPLMGPLGTAGITLIFVIFILLQRDDLQNRLVKLVSGGDLNLATQAVDDATQRITRYLLMQTVINVTYGVPIGLGLYFIGVPNALLWGLLATLLRFIPFVGPWIAAVFPVSLAFAVDPGWTMPLLTIALVLVMELISNNIVEPWLYGSSTGISAVALLFAALVWTWIWGPVGLFLSTPLTVCLLVIGKNVPSLGFLNVILGSEPVLAPEAQMYQRMLAMDQEAMLEAADKYMESETLNNFYDRVLVPALAMAERDRHAGTLAENRQQFIFQGTRDLIEDLGERNAGNIQKTTSTRVVCVPAQDDADELTALMFAQLLRHEGTGSEALAITHSTSGCIQRVRETGADVVCLCAIPPGAVTGTRRRCRQLVEGGLEAKLVAGVWGTKESATAVEKRMASNCPDLVATTFADALVQIRNTLTTAVDNQSMMPAPIPSNENERMEQVRKLGLLDSPPEELYDAVTRKLSEIFQVPISLVTIVDADRQFWKSQVGLPQDLAAAREGPRSMSLCGHVVAQNELLVVEDLTRDSRFAGNPFVKERGIRFYAGAPLRTSAGHAVGSLCVIDIRPRSVSEEQKWLLQILAEQLMRAAEFQQEIPVETLSSDKASTRSNPSPASSNGKGVVKRDKSAGLKPAATKT